MFHLFLAFILFTYSPLVLLRPLQFVASYHLDAAIATLIPLVFGYLWLAVLVSYGVTPTRTGDRYERFIRRCRRRGRLLNRIPTMRKRALVKGYCWLVLFPTVDKATAQGVGPYLSKPVATMFMYNQYAIVKALREELRFDNVGAIGHVTRKITNYPWPRFLGADIQAILNTSLSVNASVLGQTEAGNQFKEGLSKAIKVHTALTAVQRSYVQSRVPHPIVFTDSDYKVTDHPAISAFREIARTEYDRLFNIRHINRPTLAIGSGRRERIYAANDAIDHYHHFGEGKDYQRSIAYMLEQIADKSAKVRRNIGVNLDGKRKVATMDQEQVLDSFNKYGEVCGKHFSYIPEGKHEVLLFEDSIYNIGRAGLHDLFRRTGANVGYGYAFMPNELLFPDAPGSKLYTYRHDPITGYSTVTYKSGYANGYTHKRDDWAAIMDTPVFNYPDFSLLIEIDARAGPMVVFKIIKVNSAQKDTIVREIGLPDVERYGHLIDLKASFRRGWNQLCYFPVRTAEVFELYNYLAGLAPDSRTQANAMAYVRRRSGGVSLINREIQSAWELDQPDMNKFCAAVLIALSLDGHELEKKTRMAVSAFISCSKLGFLFNYGVHLLGLSRIFSGNDFSLASDRVFINCKQSCEQRATINATSGSSLYSVKYGAHLNEDSIAPCDFCKDIKPKIGTQLLICHQKEDVKRVEISLSTQELQAMRDALRPQDGVPNALQGAFDAAREAMPKVGFSRTVEFEVIRAGPGTGKTFILLAMAGQADAVLSPFSKLLPEYKNLPDGKGGFYDLDAKTIHYGISGWKGKRHMYLDEFTAIDYDAVKVAIYNSGVSKVYIIGDEKQTKIQGDEGRYIGDYVDLDAMPSHELLRNYRNPMDTVHLLNKHYGYRMQAMSSLTRSISVFGPGDELPDRPVHRFAPSKATCARLSLLDSKGKELTARTYQGSTVEHAQFHLTESDVWALSNDAIMIVALSRHKKTLDIVHDGCPAVVAKLQSLGLIGEPEEMTDLPVYTEDDVKKKIELSFFDSTVVLPEEKKAPAGKVLRITKTHVVIGISYVLRFFRRSPLVVNVLNPLFLFYKVAVLLRVFRLEMSTWDEVAKYGPAYWACAYGITSTVLPLYRVLASVFPFLGVRLFRANEPGPLVRVTAMAASSITGLDLYRPTIAAYGSLDHYLSKLEHTVPFARFVLNLGFSRFSPDSLLGSAFCDITDPLIGHVVATYRAFSSAGSRSDTVFMIPIPTFEGYIERRFPNLDRSKGMFDAMESYLPTLGAIGKKTPSIVEAVVKLPRLISPMDAYLYAKDCLPAWSINALGLPYPNLLDAAVFPGNFRGGVISIADFLRPTNARGHPNKARLGGYCLGATAGHRFSPKQSVQTLQVMAGRYLNRKSKAVHPDEIPSVVNDMVACGFRELFNDSVEWDDADLEMLLDEFLKAAATRHYETLYKGPDNPDVGVIRFHLKAIFKPALSDQKPMDPSKPGQGISAFDKDLQITFGLAWKWINFVTLKSLKPNVIYDNRMSVEQMIHKVRVAAQDVQVEARSGVTDFSMYDSQQDDFTIALEKAVLSRLHVSQDFIEHYYRFRKGQSIVANGISGRLDTEKPSGEPATLWGNSMINLFVSNWVLRGEGPFVMAVKGDDQFKKQAKLAYHEGNLARFGRVCRLKMKLYLGDFAEFCGFVIGPTSFAPNIPRKLVTLMGHEFRDYAHFAEYQQSLRQWIGEIESQNKSEIFAINCEEFGLPINELESIYGALVSYSHISEEQWMTQVERVEDPAVFCQWNPDEGRAVAQL